MIERIDTWIGKTMFVPLIIRICQLFGCTQHRFHRVCWFIACLVAFYFTDSLPEKLCFGVAALWYCMRAATMGDDVPTKSWMWFRLLMAALTPLDLMHLDRIACDVLVLFAEYASTIRTIPPLETRERQGAYRPVRMKG